MKLVRDKVPEQHPQHFYRPARDIEIAHLRNLKLLEEAGEVISARNKGELLEELSDLIEVVALLAEQNGLTLDDIAAARNLKRRRLGGFDNSTILVEYKAE